jgi:GNAT superfamily N-acetyltransferase
MKIQFLADRSDAVPTVADWYFKEWGYKEPGNSIAATCERLRGKLNREVLPIPLVAVDGDETILGCAQLKFHEMENVFPDRKFWLGGVYVSPQARGHGVASALVGRAAELAQNINLPGLWLQTEAIDGGLYSRLGWDIVEKVSYRGEEVTVMYRGFDV